MATGLNQTKHPLAGLLQRLLDAALLVMALWLSTRIMGVAWVEAYNFAIFLSVVLFLLAAGPVELYDRSWRSVSLNTEGMRILYAWVWVIVGLLVIAYVTKTTTIFSRLAVTSWFIATPALLLFWRAIGRYLLARLGRPDISRKVAIAGAGKLGKQLAEAVQAHPNSGMQVAAFYDDFCEGNTRPLEDLAANVAGNLNQLVVDAKAGKFDEIYLALPMRAEGRIREITDRLSDTSLPVYLVPDLFAFTLLHAQVSDLAGMPLVSVYGTPHHGMGGTIKRVEDVILSLLILTIVALPMLLIAVAIKLTSRGPVLFKQRRYGMGGEEVVVWKFRSMKVLEDDAIVTQATRDDPRVTKLGRFLRRTSLDELPQFINVLQGHMSIVGPRPHAVTHNEEYRSLIKGYMLRHLVKPGITGWAQVNGWRGETETLEKMEKRIEYDLEYIRNWSLWFDLKIIILTVMRELLSKKAY